MDRINVQNEGKDRKMKKAAGVLALLFVFSASVYAKDDWHVQMHKWVVASQSNPKCNAWYTVGIYRPGMGSQPEWGLMSEEIFQWFSGNGEKIAPAACVVNFTNLNRAQYRILISETPVRTETQTVHGAEVQSQTTPTQSTVTARTTYMDGTSSTTTGTISGAQTTTVVVPTETTYSQSARSVYMYTYRVDGSGMHLIASGSVDYTRVRAYGTGEVAGEAALGAGIRNAFSASKDKHRADKLYKNAMESIAADSGGGRVQ
jgi:hypothetical protein